MDDPCDNIIVVNNLNVKLGGTWIHNDTTFQVKRGEILAIVGGSGTGKSVLLRCILRLQPFDSGSIFVFKQNIATASLKQLNDMRRRWGMMFQQSALFSSLTVLENVSFPLQEFTTLDKKTIRELAILKIAEAGLPLSAANKYPAELSGGMQKRAALARAIILDPELLFLDEPTAGLDPNSAAALDTLVLNLQKTLGLTVVMVTHDLDSLWKITNRVAFLGEGRVLAVASMQELVKSQNPLIKAYFSGERGHLTRQVYQELKDDPHGT